MAVKLKVFGPYGLMPRVGEKLEADFNSWSKDKNLKLEDITALTANLPDRTVILLVLYSESRS